MHIHILICIISFHVRLVIEMFTLCYLINGVMDTSPVPKICPYNHSGAHFGSYHGNVASLELRDLLIDYVQNILSQNESIKGQMVESHV